MINNTELIYELAKTVSELEIVLRFLLGFMNYHDRQYRKWFLQYQNSIVRHVHSAATPLGKPFGILENVI